MFPSLKSYCSSLTNDFDAIPVSRKELLGKIAHYLNTKKKENKPVNLVYICTHNSRRSQFGQIWAHAASWYYNLPNVHTFSGGTEATEININAINSLKKAGLNIKAAARGKKSRFLVYFDDKESPLECFSKVYDDQANPQKKFAAIMTCSDAEQNCPYIPGAELRIGTTYDDPKAFDNTPFQDAVYDKCCRQIALETFYAFSLVQ